MKRVRESIQRTGYIYIPSLRQTYRWFANPLLFLILLLALPAAAQDTAPVPTLIPAPGAAITFQMAEPIVVAPGFAPETLRTALDETAAANMPTVVVLTSGSAPFEFEAFVTSILAIVEADPDAIQIEDNLNDGRIPPELYVGLMRQAFAVIKRANTETLVLAGTLLDSIEGENCGGRPCSAEAYRAALVTAGLPRFADCIGVGFDASDVFAAVNLAATFNPYAEAFPDKPICLTLENAADPAELLRAAQSNGRVRLLLITTP